MDVTSLSPEQMELLAELEHIRWCRYHQFHNWRMGISKNGARKDATLRIHKDLIPYDELTEEEKEKDKDNIRMLLKLFAEGYTFFGETQTAIELAPEGYTLTGR